MPHATPDADFTYTLVETPSHGHLLLSTVGQDLSSASQGGARVPYQPVQLGPDSKFTQLDLLAGHLKYRLDRGAGMDRKPLEDMFKFRVETREQTREGLEAFRQELPIEVTFLTKMARVYAIILH